MRLFFAAGPLHETTIGLNRSRNPRWMGLCLDPGCIEARDVGAHLQAKPWLAMYPVTKAFFTSFGEAVYEEVKRTGVHVTALRPGPTRTELQSLSNTEELQRGFPVSAWLSAERVAAAGLADCAKGRAISVPGALYKGLVWGSAVLPRAVKRWVYATAMKRG